MLGGDHNTTQRRSLAAAIDRNSDIIKAQ